jgi:hypothetical protein
VIPGLLAFFYTVPLARSSLSSPSPPSFQGALSACPEAGRSPCTVFPLPLPTTLPTLISLRLEPGPHCVQFLVGPCCPNR